MISERHSKFSIINKHASCYEHTRRHWFEYDNNQFTCHYIQEQPSTCLQFVGIVCSWLRNPFNFLLWLRPSHRCPKRTWMYPVFVSINRYDWLLLFSIENPSSDSIKRKCRSTNNSTESFNPFISNNLIFYPLSCRLTQQMYSVLKTILEK